jgi:large subunit ribosomal protein L22
MFITAKLRRLRIAPRKVRLVVDLIRGKSVEEAQTILNFTVKKAVLPVSKLLKSAVANAKVQKLDENNLYISKITVDEGQKLKRWMPRARGQAYEIQKKTVHITLILDEIKKGKKIKTKKTKDSKEVKRAEKAKEPKKEDRPEGAKPESRIERGFPKVEKGVKRIFRRKSF